MRRREGAGLVRPAGMTVLALVFAMFLPFATAVPVIVSIQAEPSEPTADQAIVVSVTVANLENVTKVWIEFCTSDFCSVPAEMSGKDGTYNFTFVENKFKAGEVTFGIVVDYTVDDSYRSVNGSLTIHVAAGESAPPADDDDGEAPGFEAVIVLFALIPAMLLGRRRVRP